VVAVAAKEDERWVALALEDYEHAPIGEGLRATLRFLEKLTLTPKEVTAADVDRVRKEGVSEAAIEEAIYVCAVFNTIDRIADAFGFEKPTPKDLRWAARLLLRIGYG